MEKIAEETLTVTATWTASESELSRRFVFPSVVPRVQVKQSLILDSVPTHTLIPSRAKLD